ncbi:MAG: hypothetical protein IAF38_22165 [Bacteroidia bacterium]|nr:hypothetical protein [Bacteroidia bacterium]
MRIFFTFNLSDMIHPQNLYEPQSKAPEKNGKYALIISLANVVGYLLMCGVTMAIESHPEFLFFVYGLIFAGLNLVSMIVFIALKKPAAWITNIIFLFLFPIIGFFSCSAVMSGGFH